MTIKQIFDKHKAEENYGARGLCRLSLEDDFYKKCIELESQLKEVKELNDQLSGGQKLLLERIQDLHTNEEYDKLEAEKKELIEDLQQTISNLEDKQKSFLGTNGEMARANFKLGLGWAIEAFRTRVDNISKRFNQ